MALQTSPPDPGTSGRTARKASKRFTEMMKSLTGNVTAKMSEGQDDNNHEQKQPLTIGSNVEVSEITLPMKRKRGRPRKDDVLPHTKYKEQGETVDATHSLVRSRTPDGDRNPDAIKTVTRIDSSIESLFHAVGLAISSSKSVPCLNDVKVSSHKVTLTAEVVSIVADTVSINVPSSGETAGCKVTALPGSVGTDNTVKRQRQQTIDASDGATQRKRMSCKCQVCGKVLSNSSNLKVHMRIHNGEKPFACNQCDKKFTIKVNYERHLLRHNEDRPFKCDLCGFTYYEERLLKAHQEKHRLKKPINSQKVRNKLSLDCHICGRKMKKYADLIIHVRAHTGERPFKCDYCGRAFNVKCNFKRHLLRHSDNRQFKCRFCNKEYAEKRHLVAHTSKYHQGKTDSDIIVWNSTQSGNVTTTSSPAAAPQTAPADIVVAAAEDLLAAMAPSQDTWTPAPITKQGNRSLYQCKPCGSLFQSLGHCQRHVTNLHKDADGRDGANVLCDVCGRHFRAKQALKRHQVVHTNDKPFTCTVCCRAFKQRSTYHNHMLCHSTQKTFVCKQCGRCFKQHQNLWRHLQYHKNARAHACLTCDARFSVKSDLRRHEKIHAKRAQKVCRCPLCPHQCDRLAHLGVHLARCHPHQLLQQAAPRPAPDDNSLRVAAPCPVPDNSLQRAIPHPVRDDNSLPRGRPKPNPIDRVLYRCLPCGLHFNERPDFMQHLAWHDAQRDSQPKVGGVEGSSGRPEKATADPAGIHAGVSRQLDHSVVARRLPTQQRSLLKKIKPPSPKQQHVTSPSLVRPGHAAWSRPPMGPQLEMHPPLMTVTTAASGVEHIANPVASDVLSLDQLASTAPPDGESWTALISVEQDGRQHTFPVQIVGSASDIDPQDLLAALKLATGHTLVQQAAPPATTIAEVGGAYVPEGVDEGLVLDDDPLAGHTLDSTADGIVIYEPLLQEAPGDSAVNGPIGETFARPGGEITSHHSPFTRDPRVCEDFLDVDVPTGDKSTLAPAEEFNAIGRSNQTSARLEMSRLDNNSDIMLIEPGDPSTVMARALGVGPWIVDSSAAVGRDPVTLSGSDNPLPRGLTEGAGSTVERLYPDTGVERKVEESKANFPIPLACLDGQGRLAGAVTACLQLAVSPLGGDTGPGPPSETPLKPDPDPTTWAVRPGDSAVVMTSDVTCLPRADTANGTMQVKSELDQFEGLEARSSDLTISAAETAPSENGGETQYLVAASDMAGQRVIMDGVEVTLPLECPAGEMFVLKLQTSR